MNKLTSFVVGVVVGTFGFAYFELKDAKNGRDKFEDDDYEIPYTVTPFKNGDYFIRGYVRKKANK